MLWQRIFDHMESWSQGSSPNSAPTGQKYKTKELSVLLHWFDCWPHLWPCVKPLSQCLLHYTQTGDYMVALWMRVHAFASMYLSVRARESIYALLLLWVKSTCMFHARLMVHFKWSMANPSVLFTLIYWCFPTAPYFCHVFNWQQLYIPDSFSID